MNNNQTTNDNKIEYHVEKEEEEKVQVEEEEEEEVEDVYYDGLQDSKHMKYYSHSNKTYENKRNDKVSPSIIPLKSQDIQSIAVNGLHILPWKLNLMAVSFNSKYLFTAEADVINVRNIDNPNLLLRTITLDTMEMTINQIRLGILDGEEVLASVDEGGFIRIIFVNDFEREPIRLYNSGSSTWGISLCPSKPLIAVSANNHKITIWNLDDKDPQANRVTLPKHKHNIPCIDFSPCGNYLISVSIDKNIRVWDINKKQLLRIQTLAQWCWACRWIDLTTKDDQLIQQYYNRISNNNQIDKEWRGLTEQEEHQLVEQNQEVEPIPEDEEEEEDDFDDDDEIIEEEEEQLQQQQVQEQEDDSDQIIENGVFTNEDDIIFEGGLPPVDHQQEEEPPQDQDEYINIDNHTATEASTTTTNSNNNNTTTTTTTTNTTVIKKPITPEVKQLIENDKINSKTILDKSKLPSHIVFSTYQNLYLSEVELEKLMILSNAIPTTFPIIQTQIDRIAFLEVIPELSLVISASQGPARLISLYRIINQTPINNSNNNDSITTTTTTITPGINMFLESVLSPPSGGPSLIVGLSVVRNYVKNNPLAFSINLYVMYINGIFINFHIKRSTIKNKPAHQNSVFFDPTNRNNIFGLDISSFGV